MASYLARFSPTRAGRDLFSYMRREGRNWRIMLLCAAIVFALFAGFIHDSHFQKDNRPDIIYVEQWPASRTEAEIIAANKANQIEKDKRQAAEDAVRKKNQEAYKRLDDKLKAMGI
ncbi:hypothetical protein ACLB0R_13550 [Sphingomonas sp. GlSt437]|uniref:hypothetical protein n=1 Tax=Sphingomonas sp. GlSt437 TaxID=3389970 RepID=UPI003A8C849D